MERIRIAGLEDIDIIHHLANEIWPVAYKKILSPSQLNYMLDLIYSRDALVRQMSELSHHFLLSIRDHLEIGFASFSPAETDPSTFRLHKLYVLQACQGSGAGKRLLQYVINEAEASGARTIELNVNRDNPAIEFYKRMGFIIMKEVDIDIGNGYFMNDFIMEKKIVPEKY